MSSQKLSRLMGVVAMGAHLWTGCATSHAFPPVDGGPSDYVIVDGRPVQSFGSSLLDVLRLVVPTYRLGPHGVSLEEEPILILNGVRVVAGVRHLAGITPREVRRVTTLRGPDAFQRYGAAAYHGAIVVETRNGR